MSRLLVFAVAIVWCCNSNSAELEKLWSIDARFNMPESAAFDPVRNAVYVSNVNQYAKDGNGFISRVAADGTLLELQWMTGLHSPTGLAVQGDMLYAVDYDALVIIDLRSESIVQRIPAEDAADKPALNDVAVSKNGEVFVSGSRSRTIYKLSDGRLQAWLRDPQLLESANGLYLLDHALLHGGMRFSAFDLNTRTVKQHLSSMGKGLVDIDGITAAAGFGYIVTLIDDKRLWLLREGQQPQALSQDAIDGIDIQFVENRKLLLVPQIGGSLSAYRIDP